MERLLQAASAMSFPLDIQIHTGNVLYLFAFIVRDIPWLRILAVIAAAWLISYFYFRQKSVL
jgi:hypothetical protein